MGKQTQGPIIKMTARLIELKSKDYSLAFTSYIESLHQDQAFDFCDVTLVSDDDITIQAHKILLSSHSNFLKSILKKHAHTHPLIYLHGIKSSYLGFILDYIYKGEVHLYEDQLNGFLEVAEKLKIRNLTKNIAEEDVKEELTNANTKVRKDVVFNDVENKGASICELDQKIAELFHNQPKEKSHTGIQPLNNKTSTTPRYLDIFDQSVNSPKQINKAKELLLIKPEAESKTQNDTCAQSQALSKKSEEGQLKKQCEDKGVNFPKQISKAKKITLITPKVESNPCAQSQAPTKKSEGQIKKQCEDVMFRDLVSINGAIFICKYCGQKSKNKDFILKHVGTHPHVVKLQ